MKDRFFPNLKILGFYLFIPSLASCMAAQNQSLLLPISNINPEVELINASRDNNIEEVNELIQLGVNVNFCQRLGQTALMIACLKGNVKIVELLINAGADINLKDIFDKTAFYIAVQEGHLDIVELLIQAGADINEDYFGSTALTYVCDTSFNKEMASLLIKYGANVDLKNSKGYPPLIKASLACQKDLVQLLLDAGANINEKDKDGNSALKLVKKSLIKDNDFFDDSKDYQSILNILKNNIELYKQEVYKAIRNDDKESFKKYILKIGTICFKDKKGNNVLHYAMGQENMEFIKLILAINPYLISQVNNNNETPINYLGLVRPEILNDFETFLNAVNKKRKLE